MHNLIHFFGDLLDEAVMVTDTALNFPGPKILYVNKAFSRMSGYSPDEVLGRSPRMFQGAKTSRPILARLKDSLRNGQRFEGRVVNYRKDGQEYWVELCISPVIDDDRGVCNFVSVLRPVSANRRELGVTFSKDVLASISDQLLLAATEMADVIYQLQQKTCETQMVDADKEMVLEHCRTAMSSFETIVRLLR